MMLLRRSILAITVVLAASVLLGANLGNAANPAEPAPNPLDAIPEKMPPQ
jgi:hypothetical protein